MFKNYGARGIRVCKRWLKFENFYEDMGDPPTSKHSLDRIDNNKGYNKKNCRWATPREQCNNKRNNKFIEHNGRKLTLSQWGRELGINWFTILSRLNRGCSTEEAFSKINFKTKKPL